MKLPGLFIAIICMLAPGTAAVKAAGVAAIKQQSYHRDCSARAVAYSRIIDSHGPYLRIVSGSVNIDILKSNLAGRVELPDGVPASIMDEEDLEPLRGALVMTRDFLSRFPNSAPMLEARAEAMAAHIRRFDAGEVRFEGAWVTKGRLMEIAMERHRADTARELAEVEKSVYEAAQRDQGLELHNGRWMTRSEIARLAADAPTELSDAMEPLGNGDLDGAGFAVKNLSNLADRQTGAVKVRTQRLMNAVRNLFLAESRLSRQLLDSTAKSGQAAIHEKNAREWLKPNGFGTVYGEVAAESRKKALKIRQRSADDLEARRKDLLDQLRETESVAEDFKKLREQRVVRLLETAARAVAARNFKEDEFRPAVL